MIARRDRDDGIAGTKPAIGEGASGEMGAPSLHDMPALRALAGPWLRHVETPDLVLSVPTGRVVMQLRADDATAALAIAAPALYSTLYGCALALRSYEYGNAATDLARDLADAAELVLAQARGEPL